MIVVVVTEEHVACESTLTAREDEQQNEKLNVRRK